jgi:hypothetical protein
MTIHNATPDNVWTVVNGAAGGDTVQLEDGTYYLGLSNLQKTSAVVIEPKPGSTVKVRAIVANGSKHLTFRDLHVTLDLAWEQYGLQVSGGATDILAENLIIEGPDPAHLQGVGVHFRYLGPEANVVLRDSEIRYLSSAISVVDADGVTIDHNAIHDISADGIVLAGAANAVVTNNTGTNFTYPEGVHPDFIQLYNSEGPVRSVTLKGNRFDRGTGMLAQGIFIENGEDITIEDNVFFGTMYNAISLSWTQRFKLNHNYVQPLSVEGDLGSWIMIRGGANDGDVYDNGTPTLTIGVDGEVQPTNVRVSGTIQTFPAPPGDNTQYDAWLAATGDGSPPEPTPTPPGVLLDRIDDLNREVANLQFQLDAATRRMTTTGNVLLTPLPEPKH